MINLNKYILEKLKINKDTKLDNPNDYRAISIDDSRNKKKIEDFINKYEDTKIYVKKNDSYLYILPEEEAYNYLCDFDLYAIVLVNTHRKSKKNEPDFIGWDTLNDFIKDCEDGKVDYRNLFYES